MFESKLLKVKQKNKKLFTNLVELNRKLESQDTTKLQKPPSPIEDNPPKSIHTDKLDVEDYEISVDAIAIKRQASENKDQRLDFAIQVDKQRRHIEI